MSNPLSYSDTIRALMGMNTSEEQHRAHLAEMLHRAKAAEAHRHNMLERRREYEHFMRIAAAARIASTPVDRRVYNELKHKHDVLQEENAALRRQLEGRDIAAILSDGGDT